MLLREEVNMAMPSMEADQEWRMLTEVEEEERRTKMLQRYTELAALPEEERVSRLLMWADAESNLPNDKVRTLTLSRLSVWLMLDSEVAQRISTSYDEAMRQVPGLHTTRGIVMAKMLAPELPTEERQQLAARIPSVFGSSEPAPAKRRWWPFGKR